MKKQNITPPTDEMRARATRALKKLGAVLAVAVLLYALLKLIIAASEFFRMTAIFYVGMTIYAVAAGGLIAAYYILNGGTFDKEAVTADDLPEDWDSGKKSEYLARLAENRRRARKLIYIIFPLVIVMVVYYIETVFFV